MGYSIENLIHFTCDFCEKWWSVGDAPVKDKNFWYCPWCGKINHPKEIKEDLTKKK